MTDGQDLRIQLPRFPAHGGGHSAGRFPLPLLHAILGNGSKRGKVSADPLAEGRYSAFSCKSRVTGEFSARAALGNRGRSRDHQSSRRMS